MAFSGLNDLLARLSVSGGSLSNTISTVTNTSSELPANDFNHRALRREEREHRKNELQDAIKYGRRERANPGRDGSRRWRFIHRGMIYVTDETMRHEITSWRMKELDSDEGLAAGSEAETGIHTVLVVDNSGSMRKTDVPGYPSRTAAVYDCLARDFLQPQLANMINSGNDKSNHVVSLIEMSDTATVIFNRHPIDEDLTSQFKERADMRARSHGNYLPALDKLLELLRRDAAHGRQLFLLFLSDGAPSDHVGIPCEHGTMVWQETTDLYSFRFGGRRQLGKSPLPTCLGGDTRACRAAVKQQVTDQCAQRIQQIGDLYGRDRTYIGTVAFGPPSEDYAVLQTMAAQLPRGSFQKLGLSALQLRTAFSSLTSSLTSLRADAAARPLTQRALQMERGGARGSDGWDVYRISAGDALSKQRYDLARRQFVAAPYEPGSDGVAHSKNCFGQVLGAACPPSDHGGLRIGSRAWGIVWFRRSVHFPWLGAGLLRERRYRPQAADATAHAPSPRGHSHSIQPISARAMTRASGGAAAGGGAGRVPLHGSGRGGTGGGAAAGGEADAVRRAHAHEGLPPRLLQDAGRGRGPRGPVQQADSCAAGVGRHVPGLRGVSRARRALAGRPGPVSRRAGAPALSQGTRTDPQLEGVLGGDKPAENNHKRKLCHAIRCWRDS
jgi:hypothetical protein